MRETDDVGAAESADAILVFVREGRKKKKKKRQLATRRKQKIKL